MLVQGGENKNPEVPCSSITGALCQHRETLMGVMEHEIACYIFSVISVYVVIPVHTPDRTLLRKVSSNIRKFLKKVCAGNK